MCPTICLNQPSNLQPFIQPSAHNPHPCVQPSAHHAPNSHPLNTPQPCHRSSNALKHPPNHSAQPSAQTSAQPCAQPSTQTSAQPAPQPSAQPIRPTIRQSKHSRNSTSSWADKAHDIPESQFFGAKLTRKHDPIRTLCRRMQMAIQTTPWPGRISAYAHPSINMCLVSKGDSKA